MVKGNKNASFIIAILSVVCATVIICVSAASCFGGKITFENSYYFVCYRTADNSVSASSISDTASSYGGAGYILNYDGNYYVIISCYYNDSDAQNVCSSLKKRDLDCSVLEIKTKNYKLKSVSAKNNTELYLGNLNTLNSLSHIAYDCANGLDTGEINQDKAKEIVGSVKSGLVGLLYANSDNCFTHNLNALINECEQKERGFLYSKDMRFLQIAIIDVIIKAEIY